MPKLHFIEADLTAMSGLAGQIKVLPNFRVPLRDGRHLSARLWLPIDALDNPVPALVEHAPFRHYDFSYPWDEKTHPWFAANGYASIRLDPAGSMNSSGIPKDEYVQREQEDCLEALDWISNQPWCTGNIGMFGMSWSANSALQIAALRPPSLKAIIPVHGTDDRGRDDIHYKGGCLLTDGLAWGALYQSFMLRPPHPDLASNWRSDWLARLEDAPEILALWLSHDAKDSYWQHASVSRNYSSIQAATYLVAGWADAYSNASIRLAEHLECPTKLLIGPWGHAFPHLAQPGPQIGFLQEAKRWWDRWLKDVHNGVEVEDNVTLYLQDSQAPDDHRATRKGKWINFSAWPSDSIEKSQFFLGDGKITDEQSPDIDLVINTPLANGMHAGEWLAHGIGPEMPGNQASEDKDSLCFDSVNLSEDVSICGSPEVQLRVKRYCKNRELLVRLNDIRPDGRIALITYGLLSSGVSPEKQSPDPSTVNEWSTVTITLDAIAQTVPKGHRLRLAISNRAWPMIWPSADSVELLVSTTESKLTLPLLDAAKASVSEREFEPGTDNSFSSVTWLRSPDRTRNISLDSTTGKTTRTFNKDNGAYLIQESDTVVDASGVISYSSIGDDPLSAQACFDYHLAMGKGDWQVALMSKTTITADDKHFHIAGIITALEHDAVVFKRPTTLSVPRK